MSCIFADHDASVPGKIIVTNNALIMNSSQLLYKISNLQYNIRMKKAEYVKAVNANDQYNIDLNNAALKHLKEELANTVKAFDAVPADNPSAGNKGSKKPRKWWHNFFTLKARHQ